MLAMSGTMRPSGSRLSCLSSSVRSTGGLLMVSVRPGGFKRRGVCSGIRMWLKIGD
jgi:hypothetical protein